MEYPFKDLMPLDEVLEREGYYKDWTHLDPKVFYSLTQISEYIKTKGFGVDVRLLIAQLAEHFGLKTAQVVDLGNLIQAEHATLKQQVQQAVAQVNADRNALETKFNQSVAQMEADKDAVIANATVDSEVILARGGKPTLQARLDDTDAQLTQNAIDVQTFGAFPDVVSDQSSAIQEAVDSANTGQRVLLTGNFYISKPIILPKKTITLEGLNYRETGLTKMNGFTGEGAVILEGESATDANRIKYSQFKNFFIEGNNNSSNGLVLKHLNFPVIENVMSIRNKGTGVYIEDIQDMHSVNLVSIFNTINMAMYGRNTGFDFYKILLKYGGERNLLITTDGQLDGGDYSLSNRSDRVTFWGGLIEGDSFTEQPTSEQSLVVLQGCSKITFNDVGFSKGKYSSITGIKIDRVNAGGLTFTPRDIFFNNNIMHSSTPPDSGKGIHIVQANNVIISKFKVAGIDIPIQIESQAFETVVTRDCDIDFSKIVNNSSTTFETSRRDTGYWSYMSKLHIQTPYLQLGPTETTSTRELVVDPSSRQTKLRRTAGSEGGAIDFFKIYGSGIFEPYVFSLNNANPATTIAGTFRLSSGFLEIRNSTNTGWDAYQKVSAGSTVDRPSVRPEGFCYFDTTIKKAIWWVQGSGWLDSSGNVV